MKRLQPVIWTKGTFLTPQHLQVQDRFIESLLEFRLQSQGFRPWGFTQMSVDQEALEAGTFSIEEASGIFPDGLSFEIPDSDQAPDPRPFAEDFEPDEREIDVFLAIPSFRDMGANVTIGENGPDRRFCAEPALFRDENTGRDEKQILVARKSFRVLTDADALEGVNALRIARVQRTEAETFQLAPYFVPPLIDIACSDYLVTVCRRLVEILSAKSVSLSGPRRQKKGFLADFTTSDIANFWLLYTVNTYLPVLRHLFETRRGHPEILYSNMLSMAGALTTFSKDIRPGDLPVYDHNELGDCFSILDEKLRYLLETVVPSNFLSLLLEEARNSIYATALADDKYFTGTKLYLAIRAEVDQSFVIEKVPQLVKVCSDDHVDRLVSQAVPGVPLIHVPNPPAAIPVKVDCQYFSLTRKGGAWEAVERARNLAAYVPAEFRNPQMELVVLLPEKV